MAVTMQNPIFWDVMPCGSCENRHFGGTLVLTRATLHNIQEDGILHMYFILGESVTGNCRVGASQYFTSGRKQMNKSKLSNHKILPCDTKVLHDQ
jgi:hypothetical protein